MIVAPSSIHVYPGAFPSGPAVLVEYRSRHTFIRRLSCAGYRAHALSGHTLADGRLTARIFACGRIYRVTF